MAQGRFISKNISFDKALTKLGSDTSRMLYTWTIAHLDVEGRIHGDPELLKSIVVPRLSHITPEKVEECIKEWVQNSLVVWYEAGDDIWLSFIGFHKNQQGLKKDREAPTKIPAPEEGVEVEITNSEPTQNKLVSSSGVNQEEVASREVKGSLSKEKDNTTAPPSRSSAKKKQELSEEDKQLYHSTKDAFLSQNGGTFSNWKKEGESIKRLIKMARERAPDAPEQFMHQMIEKFWQLKQNGDQFWSGQPFTPSALSAAGIFDRVLEQFRKDEIPDELAEYYREKGIAVG